METVVKETQKLKRDQVAPQQADNWTKNFEKEESFNLELPRLVIKEETYRKISSNNENHMRVYLGLEEDGKTVCAFALPTFRVDGTATYADVPKPIIKLNDENEDWTNRLDEAKAATARWRKWRMSLAVPGDFSTNRSFIYPNAYLLTRSELNQMFNWDGEQEVVIKFGIEKSCKSMLCPQSVGNGEMKDGPITPIFDFTDPCPPNCDTDSPLN